MGTICSTTRSVQVRENKGGTGVCDRTPPRNQQYKGATGYTHRYTSIHTKQEDKSLMVANTYALASLQTGMGNYLFVEKYYSVCCLELKESEEQHFIVTVDEPTKILPTEKTEITDEQPESHINAVIDAYPNDSQIDLTETTSIESEIEIILVEQQPLKPEITDEQPESLTNAVIDTSPNDSQIDLTVTTSIDSEIEIITVEQQPLKPEIPSQPESLTNAVIDTSPNQPQIDPPETTEPIDNETENITIEQQPVKPKITELDPPDSIISTEPIQPACTPIDTTYNCQLIGEPNLNITTGVTPFQTEEYSEDCIPRSPAISPASTDASDNTLDITAQANSTLVGNEAIEYPDKANSAYDDTNQGLESDLTNVTRELDEAATDLVESVLNKNIFVTPNVTTEIDEVTNSIQEYDL